MNFRTPQARVVLLSLSYLVFFYIFRLISLTFITFTVIHSNATSDHQPLLQRIGDTFTANQVFIVGCAAILFALFIHLMQPITRSSIRQFFPFDRFKPHFSINALSGFVLALVLALTCSLAGYLSYLGIYLKSDEFVLSIFSTAILTACFFLVSTVEEFLLREVIEKNAVLFFSPIVSIAISSFAYLTIKFVQFDLTPMSAVNMVLFNIVLSMVAHNEKSFLASSFFGTAFLSTLHVLFGLPYMSQDLIGVVLLRPTSNEGLAGFISGGHAGPESGLVMMVGLVIYLYLPQIRNRKRVHHG